MQPGIWGMCVCISVDIDMCTQALCVCKVGASRGDGAFAPNIEKLCYQEQHLRRVGNNQSTPNVDSNIPECHSSHPALSLTFGILIVVRLEVKVCALLAKEMLFLAWLHTPMHGPHVTSRCTPIICCDEGGA